MELKAYCYTQGNDIADGIHMAEDVLSLMLTYFEDRQQEIPQPSAINDLATENSAFATYISCDTTVYRRLMNNTAVKRTHLIFSLHAKYLFVGEQ